MSDDPKRPHDEDDAKARKQRRQSDEVMRAGKASERMVGFKNPPKEYRFRPGQSGNPRGRPKGSSKPPDVPVAMTLKKLLIQERERQVQVQTADGPSHLSAAQALVRSAFHAGIKGQPRAQKQVFDLMRFYDKEDTDGFLAITKMQMMLEHDRELEGVRHRVGARTDEERVFQDRRLALQKRVEIAKQVIQSKAYSEAEKSRAETELYELRGTLKLLELAMEGDEECQRTIEKMAACEPGLFEDP